MLGKDLKNPAKPKNPIYFYKVIVTYISHSIFYLSVISGLESPVSALHCYSVSVLIC